MEINRNSVVDKVEIAYVGLRHEVKVMKITYLPLPESGDKHFVL